MNKSNKIIKLLIIFVVLFTTVSFFITKVSSVVLNISPTDSSKNEQPFKLLFQLTGVNEHKNMPVFNGQNWLYLIKSINIFDYKDKKTITLNTNKTINVQHLNSIIIAKLPQNIKVSLVNSDMMRNNSLGIVSIISYSALVTLLMILFFYSILSLFRLLKRTTIKIIDKFTIEDNENPKKYMYLGFLLLLVSLILLSFNYLAYTNIKAMFFNADILFLPAIMQDIWQGGSFCNWSFSVSTFFFPDYLLFLVPFLVTTKITLMFLLYLNLQLVLFFYLVQVLFKIHFSRVKSIYLAGWVIFLCSILAIIPFEQTYVYKIQLFPLFHFGAFLLLLMLLNLLLRTFNSNQNKSLYYLTIFIISALGALSDSFIIIWFVIPSIISLIAVYVVEERKIKWPCISISWCFIGIFILSCFHINSRGGVHLVQFKLAAIMKQVFLAVVFIKALWLISIIFIILWIAVLIALISIIKTSKSSHVLKFILTFYCISAVIIFSAQFFAQNLGFEVRYNLNVLFLSIIIIVPLLCRFLKANQLVALFILLAFIPFFKIKQAKFSLKEYYPANVACVDQSLKHFDVHNGIANYWDARFYSSLSKNNLKIYAVNGVTLKAFEALEPIKIKSNYDFAIINTNPGDKLPAYYLNESKMYEINGNPIQRLIDCKDLIILIYKKNGLRINNSD